MAKAAVIAAAVAAVVALLFGRFSLNGGALGVGLGVLAGAWVLGLVPRVPPREDLDRFLLVLLPAAGLAEVVADSLRGWKGWAMQLIVAVGAVPPPERRSTR